MNRRTTSFGWGSLAGGWWAPGILLGLGLLLLGAPLLAQQASPPSVVGTVRGVVLDPSTGRGIPAALVEFLEEGREARASNTTAEDGSFLLPRLPRGEFRLRVSRLGYATRTTEVFRLEGGETLTLTIWVEPSAIPLAPLEVRPEEVSRSPILDAFYGRARSAPTGSFITREEIERLQPARVSDLLSLLPGATPEGRSSPLMSSGMLFSENPSGIAGRPCPIQVFLDGRPVPRGIGFPDHPPQAVLVDHLIRPNEVEGIEFYGSLDQVPPSLRTTNALCGVMAIWRRPES